MTFRSVFISVFIASALLLAAVLINLFRPPVETSQPSAAFVRATGKCAECHRHETSAIVHQFESSAHAESGINCLDCHQPLNNQESVDHRGFEIAKETTALNCSNCHTTQYQQFLRSRHAAPAWAAITGSHDFSSEQIAFAEIYHQGAVDRPQNALMTQEAPGAEKGCIGCHSIGKPNQDGSIGFCTQCHSRHSTSIALARQPETCGQCHMGPDHSQIEIYHESKHGVLFNAQKQFMNLDADPARLTTADMSVPTCATCHMSGLENLKVTHDTTERLSYWLFAPVSERRPTYDRGRAEMKEVCLTCHAASQVDTFFANAETILASTNIQVQAAQELMSELREEGLLTPQPFDESIEFLAFDYWHYFGRTAKHGAFMGGADFVQWHGNYELLAKFVEMKEIAESLRKDR